MSVTEGKIQEGPSLAAGIIPGISRVKDCMADRCKSEKHRSGKSPQWRGSQQPFPTVGVTAMDSLRQKPLDTLRVDEGLRPDNSSPTSQFKGGSRPCVEYFHRVSLSATAFVSVATLTYQRRPFGKLLLGQGLCVSIILSPSVCAFTQIEELNNLFEATELEPGKVIITVKISDNYSYLCYILEAWYAGSFGNLSHFETDVECGHGD
ncbi:hypothetical protein IW262DRAFT_1536664 [Armillaria fumosa]|nr:hypothetical protein IW262DRAFT_1536664 [Armillaria fumosa]